LVLSEVLLSLAHLGREQGPLLALHWHMVAQGERDQSHQTHQACHFPAMVSWTNERLCSKVDQEMEFLFWLVFRSKKGSAFAR
jgi:hypothetical protein